MFKRLFDSSHNKEPKPADVLLGEIRQKLVPLGFEESSSPKYVDNVFKRGNFMFRWGLNYKDERFFFYLSKQDRESKSIEGPGMGNEDDKDWSEFKAEIMKTLNDWIGTT